VRHKLFGVTGVDWIILTIYFGFVLGVGAALRRFTQTSTDFFLAGRALPAWVCGLAFISANPDPALTHAWTVFGGSKAGEPVAR